MARAGDAPTGIEALLNIIPTNIVTAMSENDVLAVMFFALIFGIRPGAGPVGPPPTNCSRGSRGCCR